MDQKAWIVAVDMGYGHQRAAYPLRTLSPTGKVVIANNYPGIPPKDYKTWNRGRGIYEAFSRTTNIPIVGKYIFGAFNYLQRIDDFYPRRNLSSPSAQINEEYWLIRKGFGRDLIDQLNREDIPLITTFFSIAFMAEEHKFKNDIYTVICDSDISRAWVAQNPAKSRIKYLAPCRRIVDRLREYGVKEENIFLTGFPLPEENIGGKELSTIKADLAARIINLDPEHRFRSKYEDTFKKFLNKSMVEQEPNHPLTVSFAVGGAGAQKRIGIEILNSLTELIAQEKIALNLVAGTRNDVYRYFMSAIKQDKLAKNFGKNLNIIFAPHKEDYFKAFNESLRSTDVLWTKPSELVFYTALGIPILMAPPVGSQENFNWDWLKSIRAGMAQIDPRYTSEWLMDWVKSGWLAEAAMSGFLDGRQFGLSNIIDVVFNAVKEPAKDDELL